MPCSDCMMMWFPRKWEVSRCFCLGATTSATNRSRMRLSDFLSLQLLAVSIITPSKGAKSGFSHANTSVTSKCQNSCWINPAGRQGRLLALTATKSFASGWWPGGFMNDHIPFTGHLISIASIYWCGRPSLHCRRA